MDVVAVIDFETTGLSPAQGDRATEIAAVLMENGKVVDRYPCGWIHYVHCSYYERFGC